MCKGNLGRQEMSAPFDLILLTEQLLCRSKNMNVKGYLIIFIIENNKKSLNLKNT